MVYPSENDYIPNKNDCSMTDFEKEEIVRRKYEVESYPDNPINYYTDDNTKEISDDKKERLHEIIENIIGKFGCSSILQLIFSPLDNGNLFKAFSIRM